MYLYAIINNCKICITTVKATNYIYFKHIIQLYDSSFTLILHDNFVFHQRVIIVYFRILKSF